MLSHFQAFGLDIHADAVIPGLVPFEAPGWSRDPVPLRIRCFPPGEPRPSAPLPEPWHPVDATGLHVHSAEDGRVFIAYHDGTRFSLSPGGEDVTMAWEDPLSLEDAATYLLGPIMALVLRLRGVLSLHAGTLIPPSAPGTPPFSVAIAGGPGSGKSTLTAALAGRGWGVLSDDVSPIALEPEGPRVIPALPSIRLWADSAEHLVGDADALPWLTPTWEKRVLDTRGSGSFRTVETPLGAIFLLDGPEAGDDAPRARRLSAREAFMGVLGNVHTARILPDRARAQMFSWAEKISMALPVFSLVTHVDLDRLDSLCQVVESVTSQRDTHV